MAGFEHFDLNEDCDRHDDTWCCACQFTEELSDTIDAHVFELQEGHDEPLHGKVARQEVAWRKAKSHLFGLLADAALAISRHRRSPKYGDGSRIARHLVRLYITLDELRGVSEVEHPSQCVE